MAKVTGIGGAILKWPDDKADDRGLTVWHVAEKNTEWFSPSGSSFMINYRIDNMDEMLEQLKRGAADECDDDEADECLRHAERLGSTARPRLND